MNRKQRRSMKHKEWNLSDPIEARDFLKNVRIGSNGDVIEFLQDADGNKITIDDASDEQILQLVKILSPQH